MIDSRPLASRTAIVIGGGPTGLMAAEVLAGAGVKVDLFDAMPSVGRKFLLAGVGGMNITHSEPREPFLSRYGKRAQTLAPLIDAFDNQALCAWIHGLGIETFVGTSGRVFPTDMKAAPLLRAWLKRLREAGVVIHTRHRWLGWNVNGALLIEGPEGQRSVTADATVLALGGGSWQRLGSDGAWVPLLAERAVDISPLRPANCGFEVAGWSEFFRDKFAGAPVKPVALSLPGGTPRQGEFVVTPAASRAAWSTPCLPLSASASSSPAAPRCTWTCCPAAAWSRSPRPWRSRAAPSPWPTICAAAWGWTACVPGCCASCPQPPTMPPRSASPP